MRVEGGGGGGGGGAYVRYFTATAHSCSADWETSLMTLYKEFGDNWSLQPGNKLYEREALMSKKAQEVWPVCIPPNHPDIFLLPRLV